MNIFISTVLIFGMIYSVAAMEEKAAGDQKPEQEKCWVMGGELELRLVSPKCHFEHSYRICIKKTDLRAYESLDAARGYSDALQAAFQSLKPNQPFSIGNFSKIIGFVFQISKINECDDRLFLERRFISDRLSYQDWFLFGHCSQLRGEILPQKLTSSEIKIKYSTGLVDAYFDRFAILPVEKRREKLQRCYVIDPLDGGEIDSSFVDFESKVWLNAIIDHLLQAQDWSYLEKILLFILAEELQESTVIGGKFFH